MPELSDKEIVKKYLAGNGEALEILIKRYLKPIYNFVYKNIGDGEAAQDITQEVFVKMWKNLKKFKKEKKFSAWLFTIAKNTSIDFLRKKSRSAFGGKQVIPFSFIEGSLIEKSGFLETIEQKNTLEIFNAALKKLSPSYQKLVLLRQQSGLTFREIAECLNEPLDTVKSRYRRGLLALKKLLVDFQ